MEPNPTAQNWLTGGGEMGQLIAEKDWSQTPLGPLSSWPQSLRTTVSLCLASNFPINIMWGPEATQIYNDGYRAVCGESHPKALGESYRQTWASAWPAIGEPFERARQGETSFLENQRMFLNRNGYLEETFFTFSTSPIRDEAGNVAGLFHPVTETTAQMLSARRVRALRDLTAAAGHADDVDEALRLSCDMLKNYADDLPFVTLYRLEDATTAKLIASHGVSSDKVPAHIYWTEQHNRGLNEVVRTNKPLEIADWKSAGLDLLPACPPVQRGFICPIAMTAQSTALLVIGVSDHLPLDETYRGFITMLTAGISTALHAVWAYEQERERTKALAEIDRAKTTFFSNVSHEFRTPLTLILGPLEDLLALPLAKEQGGDDLRSQLSVIYRNANRLLRLVNTLLDFSRLESHRMDSCYEPTDLGALTTDLASNFRSPIERAGIQFIVSCEMVSEPAYVDREMWEKIIFNLLSNAFKFTLQGTIEVRLQSARGGLSLSVRDSGVGIPPTELPKVFERFHRVKGSGGRTHEGTGIGLALVNELTQLHGGHVEVRSCEGEGTEFVVWIPLGKAHLPQQMVHESKAEPAGSVDAAALRQSRAFLEEAVSLLPALAEAPVEGNGQSRPHILLVEDNADMRHYIERLLMDHYQITAVCNGQEGLDAARARPPDLILSDVMMPVMDGLELIRQIRLDPRVARTPILLLSARAGHACPAEGIESGADDYLVKPFSARELQARVAQHLAMYQLRKNYEQERAERRRIEESEKYFRTLAEAVPAMVWTAREDGIIDFTNERWRQHFGPLIQDWRAAVHADDLAKFEQAYQKAFETLNPLSVSVRLTADGKFRWFQIRALPVLENGRATHWFGICSDIDDQLRAIEMRDDFLSVASHELKTPITSIKLELQMLKRAVGRAPTAEQLLQGYSRTLKQVDRLTALVEELLDLTKIQSGKMLYAFEHCDLGLLLRQTLERLSQFVYDSKVALSVDIERGIVVEMDRSRMERVIGNVLLNAFTYAPGCPLAVRLFKRKGHAILTFQDGGPGVPFEKQDLIFERFERATSARKVSGLGLGLYISKEIVLAHEGMIGVKSRPGEGCLFTVEIPLHLTRVQQKRVHDGRHGQQADH